MGCPKAETLSVGGGVCTRVSPSSHVCRYVFPAWMEVTRTVFSPTNIRAGVCLLTIVPANPRTLPPSQQTPGPCCWVQEAGTCKQCERQALGFSRLWIVGSRFKQQKGPRDSLMVRKEARDTYAEDERGTSGLCVTAPNATERSKGTATEGGSDVAGIGVVLWEISRRVSGTESALTVPPWKVRGDLGPSMGSRMLETGWQRVTLKGEDESAPWRVLAQPLSCSSRHFHVCFTNQK